jgi:hypothetical protein
VDFSLPVGELDVPVVKLSLHLFNILVSVHAALRGGRKIGERDSRIVHAG